MPAPKKPRGSSPKKVNTSVPAKAPLKNIVTVGGMKDPKTGKMVVIGSMDKKRVTPGNYAKNLRRAPHGTLTSKATPKRYDKYI